MAVITKSSSGGGGASSSASTKTQSFLFQNRKALAASILVVWFFIIAVLFGGSSDGGATLPSDAAAAVDEAVSSSSANNKNVAPPPERSAEEFAKAREARPPPPPPPDKPAASGAAGASTAGSRGGGGGGGGGTTDMKSWRRSLEYKCENAKTVDEIKTVGKAAFDQFVIPSDDAVSSEVTARASRSKDDLIRRCKYVALDFGANVGDTMAHMMDAGLVSCDKTRKMGKDAKSEAHFDQAAFKLTDQHWNRITRWLVGMVSSLGKDKVGPEDYCYYGVEGNPVFTERLKKAEAWAAKIVPPPLKHAHFLTETVGAGKDGPTQLWLDTVNEKENFWGSSIYKTHQDVKKSAKEKETDGQAKAADVDGITITTLMKKTLRAFDPSASEDDKKGGHLLLKVDIEGGEYPLVEEVAESNVLCDYVAMGNRADLLIEFHSVRVTGVVGQGPKVRKHREKLEKCGVKFRGLQAWWA